MVTASSLSLFCIFALFFLASSPAHAQEPAAAQGPEPSGADGQQPSGAQGQAADVEELRRRVEVLAAEVEKLRSGEPEQIEVSDERRRALGLAPSAVGVYRRASPGVSLAGYGEVLLENFSSENESGAGGAPTTRFDFLRAVLYTGYRFNEQFLFNSEIEVEHGNEIFVEFAYVDYLINDNLSLRGGLLLLPLGLVNEFHEPNVFFGAKRPETEQRIIPTTWRENGAGLIGSFGMVNVRGYFTNGLNGAGFTSAGLRGGRQRGIQARAANMAFSGRVDVTPIPGVFAGAAVYTGGSGQEQVVVAGEMLDMWTTVAEAHGQVQIRGFDVRGLFAQASVDEAGAASLALRLPLTAPIAETMQGGYLQVGYNVLSQFTANLALTPYVRYEQVDTQHRVPAGFQRDLTRDGDFTTFGIEVKPIPQVVLKAEYQWITNAANTGRNQANVNLGYSF
jgi:cell division protein FtsB